MQRFEEKKSSGQKSSDQVDIKLFIETFFIEWLKAERSTDNTGNKELQRLYFTLFDHKVRSSIFDSPFSLKTSAEIISARPTSFSTYEINRVFLHAILAKPSTWSDEFRMLLERVLNFFNSALDHENTALFRPHKRDCYSGHFIAQIKYLLNSSRSYDLGLGETHQSKKRPLKMIVSPGDVESKEEGREFFKFFYDFSSSGGGKNVALSWLTSQVAFLLKEKSEALASRLVKGFLFCLPTKSRQSFFDLAPTSIEKLLLRDGDTVFFVANVNNEECQKEFVETFFEKWHEAESQKNYEALQKLYFTVFDFEMKQDIRHFQQKFEVFSEIKAGSNTSFEKYEMNSIFLFALKGDFILEHHFIDLLRRALHFFDTKLDKNVKNRYSPRLMGQIRYFFDQYSALEALGELIKQPENMLIQPDEVDSESGGSEYFDFFRNFDSADQHKNKISKVALRWLERWIVFKGRDPTFLSATVESFLFCVPVENIESFFDSASHLIEELLGFDNGRAFFYMFGNHSQEIQHYVFKRYLSQDQYRTLILSEYDLRWVLSMSHIRDHVLKMLEGDWLHDMMKDSDFYKNTVHEDDDESDLACFDSRALCVIFRDAEGLKKALLGCEKKDEDGDIPPRVDDLKINILKALKTEGLKKLLPTQELVQEVSQICSEEVIKVLLKTSNASDSRLASSQVESMDLSLLDESASQSSGSASGVAALIARSRNYMPIQQTSRADDVAVQSVSAFESKNN